MRACMLLAIVSLLACPPAWSDDLLLNGDFEEPLTTGWEQETDGTGGIYWAAHYHPDEDYEVWLYKPTGNGFMRLSQTVKLPGLDATFSGSALLHAEATSEAWAASSIVVAYLDDDGTTLGETAICVATHYCTWENSPSFHMIDADPDVWLDHQFRIDEELANLPAVDAARLDAIRVSLYAFVYDC